MEEIRLASQIRHLLADQKYTGTALAGSAGLTEVNISRILQGHVVPHSSTIKRIAAALNLSTAEEQKLMELRAKEARERQKRNGSRPPEQETLVSRNRRLYRHVKLRQETMDQCDISFNTDFMVNQMVIDLYHPTRRIGIQCIEGGEPVEELCKFGYALFAALGGPPKVKRLFFVFKPNDPRAEELNDAIDSGYIESCTIHDIRGLIFTVV